MAQALVWRLVRWRVRNSGGTRTVVGVETVVALFRVVEVKLKESE